jgi:prefoldin beta subunit
MQNQLPPAAQETFQEMQALQDEAADVVARKERVETRLRDTGAALGALEDVEEGTTVYRQVGTVRVRAAPDELVPVLEERTDALTARLERLEATEEELHERFDQRKEDIKHLLGVPGGPDAPDTDESA